VKNNKILILLLLLCFTLPVVGYGQRMDPKENSVYIYNFIKYTSWPKKKNTVVVGIIGNTPLENELQKLFSRKTNQGVGYLVKKISLHEARNADVILVAADASDQLKELNQQTYQLPILIISEKEGMGRAGACICFFLDEENDYKTGYQLSVRNIHARGLKVNEQILNNAVLIR
jgi:hypothetical protein